MALFPLTLLGLSFVSSYNIALALLALSGMVMVFTSTSAISRLQLAAEDNLRGRIMGLFTTSFMGLFPLGSLLQGGLASLIGVQETMRAFSTVALLLGAVLLVIEQLSTKPRGCVLGP